MSSRYSVLTDFVRFSLQVLDFTGYHDFYEGNDQMKRQNPTLLILHEQFNASLQTPTSIYLSIQSNYSFLLESAQLTHMNQYSLMGTGHTVIENSSTLEDTYDIISNSPLHFITHVGYLSYDLIEQYHNIPYKQKQSTSIFDLAHDNIHRSQWIIPTYYCVYDHVHHLVHVHKIVILNDLSNLSVIYNEHQQDLQNISLSIMNSENIYHRSSISIPYSVGSIKQRHSNMSESEYQSNVLKIKHHIHEGDIFQCVFARQVILEVDNLNEFQVYMALRQMNPSPYMYYMQFDSTSIVGASPELLCRIDPIASEVQRENVITKILIYSHPIAGTRKRGKNPIEDDVLSQDLLSDKKECAEHLMLVDLARNDIGRIVLPHPTVILDLVKVSKFMEIQYFSHVMHIVSEVQGISFVVHPLADKPQELIDLESLIKIKFTFKHAYVSDTFDVVRGLFPAGTLSGAPKHKAMQLINHFEPNRRSVYGGLVGYINGRGGMDSAIAIRTIVFTNVGNKRVALIQAGAGIVADSDPVMEYLETVNKMGACFQAIEDCCAKSLFKIPLNNTIAHSLTMVKIQNVPGNKSIAAYKHLKPDTSNPVLLIDNYDSFTFNIYHYISKAVFVVRNDQITLQQIHEMCPSHIVISPGPGFPKDSGICPLVVEEFKGLVPILGICLGHQLICETFGGLVDYAPYLMHGKTSMIEHTGSGIFLDIPSPLRVMRYHSLIGKIQGNDLVSTSTTVEDGLLMSVAHNKYCIHAVQFHPESIKSEYGKQMIKNFIAMSTGTTTANSAANLNEKSILDKIVEVTRSDLSNLMSTPGNTFNDLLDILPHALPARKLKNKSFHVFAEFKRASPSKGVINKSTSIVHIAEQYEYSNASVISVLTEPKYFKGQLANMAQIRVLLDKSDMLVLRKDFIINKYQVLQSRVYGADIILLIAAILNTQELKELIDYTLLLGMTPLVEVYSVEEAKIVNGLQCTLIGINNRNLHNFKVSKHHTIEIMRYFTNCQSIIALSGISSPQDAIYYKDNSCNGVLIGEALMKNDPFTFISSIFGNPTSKHVDKLVKICGVKTLDIYTLCAVEMVGFVFVEQSPRFIDKEDCSKIVNSGKINIGLLQQGRRFDSIKDRIEVVKRVCGTSNRPLNVGVFMNQSFAEIEEIVRYCRLDMVQLHGQESNELVDMMSVPVIKAIRNSIEIKEYEKCNRKPLIYLMDGENGGSGEQLNWDLIECKDFMLAGGINTKNVQEGLRIGVGVDCSSGVEIVRGTKDATEIKEFIKACGR
eukprot:NODE_6_length_48303_cov_0.387022.p2 type:complete len:1271 gc:universal NODE_6_length_48303_cov_0.387022:39017-35205(-)